MAKSTAPARPSEGRKAPDFTAPNQDGDEVKLSSLRGRPVVLYFYPKDNTPGCSIEAQEFRDGMKAFAKLGVKVLGISPDDEKSHCKFIEKQKLNFTLLADTGHKAAEKYGVWVEKNMYGRKFWGVQRATFLIGADGTLVKVWPKVRAKGHAAEVLAAAKDHLED